MKKLRTPSGKNIDFNIISPERKRKIVKMLKIAFAYVVVSGLIYLTGTFNPNPIVKTQIENKIQVQVVKDALALGLHEPAFEYNNKQEFIEAVDRCIDFINYTTHPKHRIPKEIIIAMAGIESGWGTSRFAIEGNALFGVRTWNPKDEQMKPKELPNAQFGVKVYKNKCKSVQHMIDIINSHPAYEEFRKLRDTGETDPTVLIHTLDKWSENKIYTDLIESTIKKLEN
jgi:hypothetical protein